MNLPDSHIDSLILTVATPRWKKVAMVIAKVLAECERESVATSEEAIAARVEALVGREKLDSQGNLSEWRYSEVRLPRARSAIMPSIIASRFFLIDRDPSKRLEVRIFAPIAEEGDYRCRYQVVEADKVVRNGHADGVDSLQALLLAIERAGVDVTVSDAAQGQRLFWNDQNGDLGLPLPKQSS